MAAPDVLTDPDRDRERMLESLRNPPADIRRHDQMMRGYYGELATIPEKPCHATGLWCRFCGSPPLPGDVDRLAPWRAA